MKKMFELPIVSVGPVEEFAATQPVESGRPRPAKSNANVDCEGTAITITGTDVFAGRLAALWICTNCAGPLLYPLIEKSFPAEAFTTREAA